MRGDTEFKVEKLSGDHAAYIELLFGAVWPEAKEYPEKWREMRVIDRHQIKNEINNGFHYFGVKINGRVVGLYKARRVGGTLVGENQAVHPAHRKRGLAKAMYKHFIHFAKNAGYKKILVNILPSQVASQKLVKQFGFKKIREYEQIPGMLVHLYEKEIERGDFEKKNK